MIQKADPGGSAFCFTIVPSSPYTAHLTSSILVAGDSLMS